MINLVSIGDRVSQGNYTSGVRFRHSVHFHGTAGLAMVVDNTIGVGPLSIVVDNFHSEHIDTLSFHGDTLFMNGVSFPVNHRQIISSEIEFSDNPETLSEETLRAFEKCITDCSHPLSLAFLLDPDREVNFRGGFELELLKRIREGVNTLFSGNYSGGVTRIRGCGFGLTPSGDDFIAGVLIALHLLRKLDDRCNSNALHDVYSSCTTECPLTGAFLKLASEGRVDSGMKQLITTLVDGNTDRVRRDTEVVLSHGASSGADLVTGFLLTLRHMAQLENSYD